MPSTREDDIDALANADVVIGVGPASIPTSTTTSSRCDQLLGAELAATRKVTDKGWMPHARQIGITGHAIVAPALPRARHQREVQPHRRCAQRGHRSSRSTPTPTHRVFGFADIGIVGDWRETVDELERQLRPLVS